MSNGLNVATGKIASQSSSWIAPWNGISFDASRAVDGNEGKWSFSKTSDSNSWWQVDLGNLYAVDSINIKNRWCKDASDPRGCLCKLSNATVSMLDENDSVIATASTHNTCGVLNVHPNFPPPCSLSCFPNARKVKLQQPSTGQPIHIFELHVTSSGVDIAKGKNATQSSTWVAPWNGKSFNASNAVDGKYWTYSRTNDANAWLEVDLGGDYAIGSLEILNRWCQDLTDPPNCLCKLSEATMSLIDESGVETLSIPIGNTCGKGHLEYILDPSTEYCLVNAHYHNIDSSPPRQLIRQPWHNRVLRKRPTKC
eukprot:scaffold64960_cov44-Cyclotella_meneghiniana.AAC.2